MVLTGGKFERTYLSGLGKGLYYGSYRTPRGLVWFIGTIIFVLMMATGFLGYQHSPKWLKYNDKHYNLIRKRSYSILNNSNSINKRFYSTFNKDINNRISNVVQDFLIEKI